MLGRLDKLFDGLTPLDRKILAICFLCFTVASDFVSGLLPTSILYVLCVVWCSNYVGGRFAMAFALIVAFFHSDAPENIVQGYQPLLYLNIAAAFLILDAVVQYKNKLLAQLYILLAHVESQSLTDPLTGIPNRRAFIARAAMALAHSHRYSEPFSLAYIDVDNFKQVNDSLGHAAGDQLLRLVASAIGSELRGDDMIARLGGHEFGIIFTHAQPASAGMWIGSSRRSTIIARTGAPIRPSASASAWCTTPALCMLPPRN
jgi:diguanylate cyclase (GGDEF)-like protein